MKRTILLLTLLVSSWTGAAVAADGTNEISANRVLLIDRSSTALPGGKATLTIGSLQRSAGVYAGDYQMKISPYFYKSEKGRLAIVVSDESLAMLRQGKVAIIVGTATTNGKGGETRHIDARATPIDNHRGTLKLWFMSGDRKMTFEPGYRFAENAAAPATVTNPR